MTRYVLPHFDYELIQSLVSTESGPGTWLKVCAPIDSVRPLLSNNWDIHEPEFLMSAKLADSDASIIPGYRVHTDSSGALAFAKVVAETGELAASGQVAIDDSFASFDKIVTAETHRRKGLGRHVMAALTGASLDHGARQGVLVATAAGAALYKALGWSMTSPVTAASHLGTHTRTPGDA
jgi:GNAT superfamily N-acetyltransferase